ncbi:MAG: hypothetical protein Q8M16_10200 [Pirellulaceae bacterium]|nr:hypothetical protein [Pirellulaceae bacterium]
MYVWLIVFGTSVLHLATATAVALSFDDSKIVGYSSNSQTLLLLTDDNDSDELELQWYRAEQLIHRLRAINGALYYSNAEERYVVLSRNVIEGAELHDGQLEVSVLDAKFQIISQRSIRTDAQNLFTISNVWSYEVSALNDGTIIIQVSDDCRGGLALSADLSEVKYVCRVLSGEFMCLDMAKLRELSAAQADRLRAFAVDGDCGLRFRGDGSRLLLEEVDPWERPLEGHDIMYLSNRDGRHFELQQYFLTLPHFSCRRLPRTYLSPFDPADVWYSLAFAPVPDSGESPPELQCQLGEPFEFAPQLRIFNRETNQAKLVPVLETYCIEQQFSVDAIVDTTTNECLGKILALIRLKRRDLYRFVCVRIDIESGEGQVELVCHSLQEKPLQLYSDEVVVDNKAWEVYSYKNKQWQMIMVPQR